MWNLASAPPPLHPLPPPHPLPHITTQDQSGRLELRAGYTLHTPPSSCSLLPSQPSPFPPPPLLSPSLPPRLFLRPPAALHPPPSEVTALYNKLMRTSIKLSQHALCPPNPSALFSFSPFGSFAQLSFHSYQSPIFMGCENDAFVYSHRHRGYFACSHRECKSSLLCLPLCLKSHSLWLKASITGRSAPFSVSGAVAPPCGRNMRTTSETFCRFNLQRWTQINVALLPWIQYPPLPAVKEKADVSLEYSFNKPKSNNVLVSTLPVGRCTSLKAGDKYNIAFLFSNTIGI